MRKIKLLFIIILLCLGSVMNTKITASDNGNDSMVLLEKFAESVTDSTITIPSVKLLQTALSGFELLKKSHSVTRTDVLTIIDFTLPSNQKRLWVLDLTNTKILFHCLVSHGRNSGEEKAENFSNKPGSYASSPGFYITNEPYDGRNGLSLSLNGIEKGINDNALKRGIVIHGAEYVSYDFISKNGRLGRSQGCPAVPENLNRDIIDAIKGGSCLFAYTACLSYTANSQILHKISTVNPELL